jgi:hypothetical protein
MPRPEHRHISNLLCDDEAVFAFVTDEFWLIGPYSQPEQTKTARQILGDAKKRFGLARTMTLEWWVQ